MRARARAIWKEQVSKRDGARQIVAVRASDGARVCERLGERRMGQTRERESDGWGEQARAMDGASKQELWMGRARKSKGASEREQWRRSKKDGLNARAMDGVRARNMQLEWASERGGDGWGERRREGKTAHKPFPSPPASSPPPPAFAPAPPLLREHTHCQKKSWNKR